jgi:very-short-patch-repair endonuclease
MLHTNIDSRVRERARRLRKNKTLGEKAMQEYPRSLRPFGAHLRREVPIGPFIVDFAWLSARIVIEVDGASHDLPGRSERDGERDIFLHSQGFRVIRLRDADVIANAAKAFAIIEEAVRPHLSPPPLTPPHKGEGNRAGDLLS